MLFQMNDRIHPFVVDGKGTAKEALDGVAQDWNATLDEAVARPQTRRAGDRSGPVGKKDTDDTGRKPLAVVATLDPRSRAAARGWSDLTIRNLFILPTIAFLIVFNIFPLIYSLGFSFTEFRASISKPPVFVGLQNYRDLLNDPNIWSNFTVTAKYVVVSVSGQMLVGFGLAMLLNRGLSVEGAGRDAAAAADDAVAGDRRAVLEAALRSRPGGRSTTRSASASSTGCRTPTTRSTPSPSPTSGCGRPS